jgi:hypothetical protein
VLGTSAAELGRSSRFRHIYCASHMLPISIAEQVDRLPYSCANVILPLVVKSTGNMLVAEVTRTFSVAAKMFRQHARYLPRSGKPSLFDIYAHSLCLAASKKPRRQVLSWYSTARADPIAAEMPKAGKPV